MLSIYMYEVGLHVSEWYMQECVYLKTAYCVRIFVHQVQSTVEAQTAEEAKILSKTARNRSSSRNLIYFAVNRNINQFLRGHGAAKTRHTYTQVWCSTATFSCGGYASTVHCPVQGTGSSSSVPGLNVCWLIKDRLRRGYKAAQLPPPT